MSTQTQSPAKLVTNWRKFHARNKHDLIDNTLGEISSEHLAGAMIEELGSVEAALRFFRFANYGAGISDLFLGEKLRHKQFETELLLAQLYQSEHPEMLQTVEELTAAWESSSKDYSDTSLSAEAVAGGVIEDIITNEKASWEHDGVEAAVDEMRSRLYDYAYYCTGSGTHPKARQALFLLELIAWGTGATSQN